MERLPPRWENMTLDSTQPPPQIPARTTRGDLINDILLSAKGATEQPSTAAMADLGDEVPYYDEKLAHAMREVWEEFESQTPGPVLAQRAAEALERLLSFAEGARDEQRDIVGHFIAAFRIDIPLPIWDLALLDEKHRVDVLTLLEGASFAWIGVFLYLHDGRNRALRVCRDIGLLDANLLRPAATRVARQYALLRDDEPERLGEVEPPNGAVLQLMPNRRTR